MHRTLQEPVEFGQSRAGQCAAGDLSNLEGRVGPRVDSADCVEDLLQIAAIRRGHGVRQTREWVGLEHAGEHRRRAFGQTERGVSTLEDVRGSAATRRFGYFSDDLGHDPEARCADLHRAQWVGLVRVEATRNQDEIGVELEGDGREQVLEHPDVLEVAATGWHGDVDGGTASHAGTRFTGGSGSRVERELVGRDVEDRRVALERVLAAVSVVDVPIQDQNPFNSGFLLECFRGDRDIVEQTEPHRAVWFRVVTGGPHSRETAFRLTSHNMHGQIHAASGGTLCNGEALARNEGVGIEVDGGLSGCCLDIVQVLGGVDPKDLVVAREPGLEPLDALWCVLRPLRERLPHGHESGRCFRMAVRGSMLLEALVFD